MTCLIATILGTILFFCYSFFVLDEESLGTKKSQLVCFCMFTFGSLLLIYRFERQPWKMLYKPICFIFDVAGTVVTLQILITLWEMVEYFVIFTLPGHINSVMELCGLRYVVPELCSVLLLYAISLSFVSYAHNSDRYLDNFLYKLNSNVDLSQPAPSSQSGRPRRQHLETEGRAHICRTTNTLPTTPAPLLRRSSRRRSAVSLSDPHL